MDHKNGHAHVQVADEVTRRTKLLRWMLARLKPREFEGNKQQCSEVLAVLLQAAPANAQRLADLNGIDSLLQA